MIIRKRNRAGLRLGTFSLLALAAACTNTTDEAKRLRESVIQSTCVPGTSCTLTYELPAGVAFDQDTLVAHNPQSHLTLTFSAREAFPAARSVCALIDDFAGLPLLADSQGD